MLLALNPGPSSFPFSTSCNLEHVSLFLSNIFFLLQLTQHFRETPSKSVNLERRVKMLIFYDLETYVKDYGVIKQKMCFAVVGF